MLREQFLIRINANNLSCNKDEFKIHKWNGWACARTDSAHKNYFFTTFTLPSYWPWLCACLCTIALCWRWHDWYTYSGKYTINYIQRSPWHAVYLKRARFSRVRYVGNYIVGCWPTYNSYCSCNAEPHPIGSVALPDNGAYQMEHFMCARSSKCRKCNLCVRKNLFHSVCRFAIHFPCFFPAMMCTDMFELNIPAVNYLFCHASFSLPIKSYSPTIFSSS